MESSSGPDASSLEERLEGAIIEGELEQIRQLIGMGADVNWKKPASGFPIIGFARQEQVLQLLLDSGANIDSRHRDGETELYFAAVNELPYTQLLLRLGADPNALTNSGETPLFAAQLGGHADIVELLVANGADVDIQNAEGSSPLHGAVIAAQYPIALALVSSGANLELRTNDGTTPLMLAVSGREAEHGELVRLLLQSGADPNATRSRDGARALHMAACWDKHETSRELVLAGAEINARTLEGETPLDIAIDEGHHQTACILRELGGEL
jgi:ankyrin repeat protein